KPRGADAQGAVVCTGHRDRRHPDAADAHRRGAPGGAPDSRAASGHRRPRALAVRRVRLRARAPAGKRGGRRLPAEGPRLGREGVRGGDQARRRRRIGPRPGGRVASRRPPPRRRPAHAADPAGARGPRADGGRQVEPGDRGQARRHAPSRREARDEHLQQAEPPGRRAGPPPRARGARVPEAVGPPPAAQCGLPHRKSRARRMVGRGRPCERECTPRSPTERLLMSPLQHSNHLAARMGRWSASHWKTAVFGWLVFVVVVFMAGNKVGANYLDQNDNNVGQAHRADQILKSAFPEKDPQSEFVLIQSTKLTAGDPAFRAVVRDVQRSVAPLPGITNFRTPYEGGHADQISAGRHSVIVQWEMKGTADEAKKKIDAVTAATAKVATRHPSFYVGEAGAVSSGKAIDEMFSKQLKNAGTRSVPLTLIILLLVFGSLVAAFIPLLLALSSVIATIGLVAFVSKVTPMDQSVSEVILLIGLAVGVDYTLFYLKREREERAAGKGHRAALEAAAATSGRAVLVSGATVLVAMAGLIFTRDRTFVSFGIGTMLVVLVSMIGSLTVLPALLSKLGDRVEKGRVPFLGRLRRPSGENRVWSKVLTPALRHPGIAALLSVGVLGAMAVPVLHLHTAESGLAALPKSAPTVETLDRIQASFTGSTQPAEVAVKTPSTDSAEFKNALLALRGKVHASPLMHGPVDVVVNPAHTVARIEIPLAGS